MLEVITENVKKKIQERNLDFNENEKTIIAQNPDLFAEILHIAGENPFVYVSALYSFISNHYNYNDLISIINKYKFSKQELKAICFSIAYGTILIQGNYQMLSSFEDILSDEADRNELQKVLDKKVLSKKITKQYGVDGYYLNLFIDNDYIELAGKFQWYSDDITLEIKKKYVKKCIEKNIEPCKELATLPVIKDLYKELSIETLINAIIYHLEQTNMYNQSEYNKNYNTEEYSKLMDEILEYLIEILPTTDIKHIPNIGIIFLFSDKNSQFNKIKEILEEKGIYDFSLFTYHADRNISLDIFIKFIDTLSTPYGKNQRAFINRQMIVIYNNSTSQEKKEIVFKKLIECGYLSYFLENQDISIQLLQKYQDLIIANMEKGLYDEEISSIFLSNNIEDKFFILIPALHKNIIKEIKADLCYIKPSIFKIIMDNATTQSFDFSFTIPGDEYISCKDFVENMFCLLEKGYIKEVLDIITNVSTRLSNTTIDYELLEKRILPFFKNNLKYALLYAEKHFNTIKTPEMIKFIEDNAGLFYIDLERKIENYDDKEQKKIYTDLFFNTFKKYIADSKGIPVERLEKLHRLLGPLFLKDIGTISMTKLLQLDDKLLDRFIDLISIRNYNLKDLEKAFISIRESTFITTFPEIANLGTTISNNIAQNNHEDSRRIIEFISENLNYKKFIEILTIIAKNPHFEKYSNLTNHPDTMAEAGAKAYIHGYLSTLYSKCLTSSQDYDSSNIILLREIIKKFIDVKRGEYVRSEKIGDILELTYDLDEKDKKDKIIKYIIKNQDLFIKDFLEKLPLKSTTDEDENTIYREDARLLIQVIKGKKEPKDAGIVMKKMTLFRDQIYNEILKIENLQDIIHILDEAKLIKRVYKIEGNLDLLELISNIDFDLLKNTLENDELYNALLKLMQNRKIHLLPLKRLQRLISDKDINENTIAAFLSYFHIIYTKLIDEGKDTDMKIAKIISEGDGCAAVSSIFSLILTPDDMRIIKANTGENRANRKTKNDERLKESVKLTRYLYEKKKITVPTSNDTITTSSGKQIRCMVGNFTSSSNLTHGDRTGACMRIGGAGERLLYFSIKNENGFHIEFRDPKTNKYLSRVTGFRNGNTIFLNELRHSLLPGKYTDNDLFEMVKVIAQNFINKTKDSKSPIENVFITQSEATEKITENTYDLKNVNVAKGYNDIYTDYYRFNAILLASTSKEGYKPLKPYQDGLEKYDVARDIVITPPTEKEMLIYINRVETVKRLLKGEDYRTFTATMINNGYQFGYANHDWYIYVDNDLVIHSNYTSDDKALKEEYNHYMEIVNEKIIEIGSVRHGI